MGPTEIDSAGGSAANSSSQNPRGRGRLVKSNSVVALPFATALLAVALWANPARADKIAEYTTSGTSVNASLGTFGGAQGLFGAVNDITVSGSHIFVANLGPPWQSYGSISEFTTSGTVVNYSLVSGLAGPGAITASGSDLFEVNYFNGTVGEYTTSGTTVNASLITGLGTVGAWDIAASGSDLFIATGTGSIEEYTTSGTLVNSSFISIPTGSYGMAVSGSDLYVVNYGAGTISEYTTAGSVVNASLVTGLNDPLGIAVAGSDLFVMDHGGENIAEYTTAGALVNAVLIPPGYGPVYSEGIATSGSDLFFPSPRPA